MTLETFTNKARLEIGVASAIGAYDRHPLDKDEVNWAVEKFLEVAPGLEESISGMRTDEIYRMILTLYKPVFRATFDKEEHWRGDHLRINYISHRILYINGKVAFKELAPSLKDS